MTPREFLKRYRFDERMVGGGFFPTEPLSLDEGDHLGVILFNLGGPRSRDEVEPFLYNLFMDPAIIDIPLPTFLREPLCRFIARRRSETVGEEYALIGGNSPLNAHTERQRTLLEERLSSQLAPVRVSVIPAMRYGQPDSLLAASQINAESITKLVLLPLYPQYSKTTTGASLAYWKALEEVGTLPEVPTVLIYEYATHPDLIAAFVGRIEEALERFDTSVRDNVYILFSAHGTPLYEMTRRGDPYCCLVHSTVDSVMRRWPGRAFQVSFQSKVGPAEWLTPSTPEALERLADEGVRNVLVVPIAFVSDHVETAFELNIEVRKEAEEAGIERFEVATGLNDHPAFIDALADTVLRHVSERPSPGGRARRTQRKAACHQCTRNAEAMCWTPIGAVNGESRPVPGAAEGSVPEVDWRG